MQMPRRVEADVGFDIVDQLNINYRRCTNTPAVTTCQRLVQGNLLTCRGLIRGAYGRRIGSLDVPSRRSAYIGV